MVRRKPAVVSSSQSVSIEQIQYKTKQNKTKQNKGLRHLATLFLCSTLLARFCKSSVYGVNIGCFDEINIRDYLTTDINDGVSMSLVVDHTDC